MTPEDYKWNINLVKDRNYALNLTFEQAEEVFKFEQSKSSYSEKFYFSTWEELDYELSTFYENIEHRTICHLRAKYKRRC